MENREKLSAFLDGELSEAEASEIEAAMAEDPALQLELEELMAADDFARVEFTEALQEPVPFDLAAAIRNAPETGAAEPAPIATRGWPNLTGLAAALALFVVGGTGGFYYGSSQISAPAPGWLADIADYHAVYASQSRHLVEVAADERDHIQTWLSNTIGARVTVPDLSGSGLNFEGARLLVAAGKPVAQLMFTDASGVVYALCVIGNPSPQEGFANRTINGFDMVSWGGDGANFVVVGPEGEGSLDAIAQSAATQV